MKLQSKVFLILASLWAIICLGIYLDSKITLERDYKKLEEKLAAKDIHRVQMALQNKLSTLRLYTNSWSQWDDAYDFMINKNERFIISSFVPGTFTSSNLNFFLFYDTQGNFYDGRAFDLTTKDFFETPQSLFTYLNMHPNFVLHHTITKGKVGIIKIDGNLIAMSSLPVITSDGKGPIRGTLLMGYLITPEFFKKISETIELNTTFVPMPLKKNDIIDTKAYAVLLSKSSYFIIPKDKNIAYGFTLLRDIENNPIGIVRIEIPRDLYNEGLLTIYHYLLIVVLLGFLILATMIYLLKMLVLNRILSVSEQVIDINSKGKFKNRINISGKDELTQMVASINSMLELIELTQEQLKYRITRRTKDMERLSLLNRDLFKEMSKQRKIETKLREDEKLLRQMAYYDTLTGLPNRALFYELLQQAITQANQDQNKLAVIFVDVDKFKKMNDTYGHDFGDKFLKVIAQRLRNSIKDTDVAARLAGDEFILFITNIHDHDALDKIISKLFENLTLEIIIDNINFEPTFSIGISIYPNDSDTLEGLINQADLAMYYAKKQESNSYRYYSALKNHHSTTPS